MFGSGFSPHNCLNFAKSPVTRVLLCEADRISSSAKPQTFPAFPQCQIHPADVHDIDVYIPGILFLMSLAGIETYIDLHFWMPQAKTAVMILDSTVNPMGHSWQKPASRWQSLRWLNTSWSCFSKYACFNTSAISLRTWCQQQSINAPSMLSYCIEGCYPHVRLKKVSPHPYSLRILSYFFTNLNGDFHTTGLYNPKGSCIGEPKSWIPAFHLLVEARIWKLEHEHMWYTK